MVKTKHICLQWLCLEDHVRTFDPHDFILNIYHRKSLDETILSSPASMNLLTVHFYQRVYPHRWTKRKFFYHLLNHVSSSGVGGREWTGKMIEARRSRKLRETDRHGEKGGGGEKVQGETAVFICCLVLIWWETSLTSSLRWQTRWVCFGRVFCWLTLEDLLLEIF